MKIYVFNQWILARFKCVFYLFCRCNLPEKTIRASAWVQVHKEIPPLCSGIFQPVSGYQGAHVKRSQPLTCRATGSGYESRLMIFCSATGSQTIWWPGLEDAMELFVVTCTSLHCPISLKRKIRHWLKISRTGIVTDIMDCFRWKTWALCGQYGYQSCADVYSFSRMPIIFSVGPMLWREMDCRTIFC